MALRVMLADDNQSIRAKLRALIESRAEWRVVGEAVNGRDAVQKVGEVKPDVLILDYSMPELDGISAIPEIHRVAPDTEIVMLTVHDVRFTVGRAVAAGARGYVVKTEIKRDLMRAVEAASQHKTFLSFQDPQKEPAGEQGPALKPPAP